MFRVFLLFNMTFEELKSLKIGIYSVTIIFVVILLCLDLFHDLQPTNFPAHPNIIRTVVSRFLAILYSQIVHNAIHGS